jgi:hypothetical protein
MVLEATASIDGADVVLAARAVTTLQKWVVSNG